MRGVQELRQELAKYLAGHGLEAVTAWGEQKRSRPGQVVAVVSLKALESGAPGFQDYLGERFDRDRGQWEELYGKKVELTFGLDLYAAAAEEVQRGVDVLTAALDRERPGGMKAAGLTVGETTYEQESRRFVCPVRGKFSAWAVAVSREDGSFLDFEVKGVQKE